MPASAAMCCSDFYLPAEEMILRWPSACRAIAAKRRDPSYEDGRVAWMCFAPEPAMESTVCIWEAAESGWMWTQCATRRRNIAAGMDGGVTAQGCWRGCEALRQCVRERNFPAAAKRQWKKRSCSR